MQRISSRTTLYFKRFHPWIMLGFVPLFFAVWFGWRTPIMAVLIMIVVITFVITKHQVSQLVDEVWHAGDALIVRNNGQEDRILLSAIVNAQYSWANRAPIVTLTLRTPGVFGDTVRFLAPVPFASIPIIHDLIDKLDDARKRAGER
jgi:hypothetical protein